MRKLLFIALVNLSCLVVPAFRASGQTSGAVMDMSGESQSMQGMPGMDTDKTHNRKDEHAARFAH